MRGKKILVTGPAGQIAFPLVAHLAQTNEIWGIARFGDPATREKVEAVGCTTRVVDLAAPDWSELPEHFDHVLHLAFFNLSEPDYDRAMVVNAEGTALLMTQFRQADSCLVVSSSSVYRNHPDGAHRFVENDPLGDRFSAYSLAYGSSKTAQEAVARGLARSLGLRTTIARMNVSYGANGGLPAYQLDMIVGDQELPIATGSSWFNPIEQADINTQVPQLLEVASVPATIVNWGGDDAVASEEYLGFLAQLVGKTARFVYSDDGIPGRALDNTRRQSLIGNCAVHWKDGMRAMAATRYPELVA